MSKSRVLDSLYKQHESAREMLSNAYRIGASDELLKNLRMLVSTIDSLIIKEQLRLEGKLDDNYEDQEE